MVTSEPPVTESEKKEALKAALTSETFARSAQLRALLQYICERELSGQATALTEYQIAVEVLGRRKDFNLADDSSVRNRVYELRQRLEKLYSSEVPATVVQIHIPRGGYVPYYTRHQPANTELQPAREMVAIPAPVTVPRANRRLLVLTASVCLVAGGLGGWYFARPHPPSILKEAWGPLAEPGDELLISIATSLHMVVRPHIAENPWRLPAPPGVERLYGPTRPLDPGTPLYMEPAQLSVPLAELSAVAILSNLRTAFGGAYQILPEAESPVAALRGRNSFLIATATHSDAARTLLRNLPLTIDYNATDQFCVLDQRKPAGKNELFVAQPVGQPVPSTLYGLLSVLTWPESGGKITRTVIFSGAGSAGVQAAAEFFCSPSRMANLKARLHGFPPAYQVVVRCKTSGLRLISYEYAAHEIGYWR
ncbi:MAG TPA: hypothetical protein VHW09_20910 [Bryobacteraceae bacterium]|jgi:hypothetical protein|nr:hypothetical protein [Bryobacteraceae bacterium]